MNRRAGRLRADALVELAAAMPGLPSREAAANAVAEALGAGDLACCVMGIEADQATGVAISIGPRSGSRLDRGTAERLLEYVVPVEGIGVLREVVRHRAPFTGGAGAMAALKTSDAGASG